MRPPPPSSIIVLTAARSVVRSRLRAPQSRSTVTRQLDCRQSFFPVSPSLFIPPSLRGLPPRSLESLRRGRLWRLGHSGPKNWAEAVRHEPIRLSFPLDFV